MEHPWIDTERTFVCALLLLLWSGILVALSTVPVGVKLLTYSVVVGLILFHVQHKQLTYETTFLSLAASILLACTDSQYLVQTVLLTSALLLLAAVCIVLPVDAVFVALVVSLALAYSLLLLLAIATKTDPAFTALGLMALGVFWLVFLRPGRRNDLYA